MVGIELLARTWTWAQLRIMIEISLPVAIGQPRHRRFEWQPCVGPKDYPSRRLCAQKLLRFSRRVETYQ